MSCGNVLVARQPCSQLEIVLFADVFRSVSRSSLSQSAPPVFSSDMSLTALLNHAISQCLVGNLMYGRLVGKAIQQNAMRYNSVLPNQGLHTDTKTIPNSHYQNTVSPHLLSPKNQKQITSLLTFTLQLTHILQLNYHNFSNILFQLLINFQLMIRDNTTFLCSVLRLS